MYEFRVNGRVVSTEEDKSLLDFLREDLRLTAVKNGCGEGACGACTVIADGKAVRACVLTTARAAGREIITPEGLTERERAVYSGAFARAGAVQCGFCTPGMVMSAKALLDKNPSPTREQAAAAIKGNLCRCTGYKKIIDAIMLAAAVFRGEQELSDEEESGLVGESLTRADACDKAVGRAEYVDDMRPEGMLYGGALRSEHPRAVILSIDTSDAEKLPGVAAVLTAADIPGERKIGHIKKDYDVMIPVGKTTHFCGDALALVAAESRAVLKKALSLIRVEYNVLTPVLDAATAADEMTPHVHSEGNLLAKTRLSRGDAEKALAESAWVVTKKYTTPRTEHAFLEPESALALPEGDGVLIYSADQGVYQTRKECAEALGLPPEKVRVIAKNVGGGFGGKEDMSVQHHAALLAYRTKRPVKVTLSRADSMLLHPKRHPMEIVCSTGCDEHGMITAIKMDILADAGAYASLSGPVLQRACTHAAGPYYIKNVEITGAAYYTNNPPSGAFRGFGVPQTCFASELNLDLLAEMAGISPWEIRRRNAVAPGQPLPNGQIAGPDTAIIETLEAVKPFYKAHPGAGIACAMKNSGLGVGIPDFGRCKIVISGDTLVIRSSAACIGQGVGTVLRQIVCDTTGFPPEKVIWMAPDTAEAPDAGNTTASRQTVFTGEAARRAALDVKEALRWDEMRELDGMEFVGEYLGETDKFGSEKEHPVSHVAYAYATHVVALDKEGRVDTVLAAHDVGRAINPKNIEGQIEGGVLMSLGWALTERFPLEDGRPAVKFGGLGLFRADMAPKIETIIIEKNRSQLACGAKGIGEICSIPTAPAAALAYYERDGRFRASMPLEGTPYSR